MSDRFDEPYDLHLQPSVVGFFDIMGFRELVEQLGKDTRLQQTLARFLRGAADVAAINKERSVEEGGFGFTAFSDSIVVSKPQDGTGWAEWIVCYELGSNATDLLANGILSRGGIVTGPVHHKDGVLIGSGMARAYELESRVARDPRIIVEDGVRNAVVKSEIEGIVSESKDRLFFRDSDGLWTIEPFLFDWVKNEDVFRSCREVIENGMRKELEAERPRLNLLARFRWLANQFNRFLSLLPFSAPYHSINVTPIAIDGTLAWRKM